MIRLVDSETMRSIDSAAVKERRIKSLDLMEAAGRGVAEVALREFGSAGRAVAIVTGKGSNGGDGYVAARYLKERCVDARVFSVVRMNELKGDAAIMARRWQEAGGETIVLLSKGAFERHAEFFKKSALIIDALLGTGLKSDVRGIYATAIDFINKHSRKTLSVDIPSGVDATTGATLGKAVRADVTATMALPKLGLYLYPGRKESGRVEVIDIGIPGKLIAKRAIKWTLLDDALISGLLKPREPDSHKGVFGHLAILAGSIGKTGAAYLAAIASLRTGAGLVTIGVPASLNHVMEIKTVEAMTFPVSETGSGAFGKDSLEDALELIKGKDALVIGPGVGMNAETQGFVRELMASKKLPPTLIDADGLNAFEGAVDLLRKAGPIKVLTPHPKEAARLLGLTVKDVQADRISSAGKLAKATMAVVVLKGATTVIASPDGRVYLNPTGSPVLSTAGTGDVLSGMIGALLANGLSALDSAIVGVYLHGLAGENVAKKIGGPIGGLASDLFSEIPLLVNRFTSKQSGDGVVRR